MNHTVYFTDQAVVFTDCAPERVADDELIVDLDPSMSQLHRAKLLKNLETYNTIYLIYTAPQEAFRAFAEEYAVVEAGGGVVVNSRGEWLMMERNGRWDFPKGHLEQGESLEVCAAREIEEETGVKGEIVRPLCDTWHAYYFPKTSRWELKCTHWYELRFSTTEGLKPQVEEGIVSVTWCSKEMVAQNLKQTFPTIRCVAQAMLDK